MNTTGLPTIDQTRARVRTVLRNQVGDVLDGVTDDDELRDVLADRYDSLAAMEFVSRIETEFGVEVDFVSHDVRFVFATLNRISLFIQDLLEDHAALGGGS